MTCAEKLDYSEEKVRRFNLTLSSLADCAQRQDTGQDVWSQIRVQWMTITSFVACYAPHVPQHVAVSLFRPDESNYKLFRPICQNRLSSVAWSTGAQLIIFFCFRFSVVLFDRPVIIIRLAAHCVCRVLVFASS